MALQKQTAELVKKYLLRGLMFSVPGIFTLWVLNLVSGVADTVVGPITRLILRLVASVVPEGLRFGPLSSGEWPFLSFLLLLFLLTVLGGFISWRYGARIAKWVDNRLINSPGIGFLYRNARMMSEFFDLSKGSPFKRVVLVEYPSPGILTLAFVCGEVKVVQGDNKRDLVKVVIPNPPTGVQGICWVEERSCQDVPDMTVEDGLRYYMSLGVMTPETVHVRPLNSASASSSALPPSSTPPQA